MLITDVINAMRAGQEIANPATWKNVQIATNVLTPLIVLGVSLLRSNGHDFGLTDDTIKPLAGYLGTIFCAVNGIITLVTSKKVGL
jgi:hypothetical protein